MLKSFVIFNLVNVVFEFGAKSFAPKSGLCAIRRKSGVLARTFVNMVLPDRARTRFGAKDLAPNSKATRIQ